MKKTFREKTAEPTAKVKPLNPLAGSYHQPSSHLNQNIQPDQALQGSPTPLPLPVQRRIEKVFDADPSPGLQGHAVVQGFWKEGLGVAGLAVGAGLAPWLLPAMAGYATAGIGSLIGGGLGYLLGSKLDGTGSSVPEQVLRTPSSNQIQLPESLPGSSNQAGNSGLDQEIPSEDESGPSNQADSSGPEEFLGTIKYEGDRAFVSIGNTDFLIGKNSTKGLLTKGAWARFTIYTNKNPMIPPKADVFEAQYIPAIDIGQNLQIGRDQRTVFLQNQGFLDSLASIKILNSAKKHFGEYQVPQNINQLKAYIMNNKAQARVNNVGNEDNFEIPLPDNGSSKNSIIGAVSYLDPEKKIISEIKIFHVGPYT